MGLSRAFGWGESKTDYNKDGRLDLYVSNLQSQNTTTSIYNGVDGSLLKTLEMPATDKQPPRRATAAARWAGARGHQGISTETASPTTSPQPRTRT